MTIKLLSEDLINKIAAGEVIERPASVVKELVENSIDAGATRIKVEVQEAGRKLIRVSDNGSGMTKEELLLAVQRHSTSKLTKLDDLFNISTLGFRGEALPSIASVSLLELASQQVGDKQGSRLFIEGGKSNPAEPAGLPVGTTVTVKDLFFNTPARKKFLKSPATETGHLGDIVTKYAIANPQISFELVSDGKPLLNTAGSGNLKDVLVSIYGVELVKNLIEVKSTATKLQIHGLISRPTLSRLDREYETFIVNGRYVKNFLLNRALEDAYRTLIPNNRYPVAVLFVEIDPAVIDVNVHPTKKEIKFAKTQEVMDSIRAAAATALEIKEEGNASSYISPAPSSFSQLPMDNYHWSEHSSALPEEITMLLDSSLPLTPLYQLDNTYIICLDGKELVLLDQHAAHERILYDQLSRGKEAIQQQSLLIPETIELSPQEALVLQDNLGYLNELGFNIELFGNNSFIVRSVPAVTGKQPTGLLLTDLIAELVNLGKSTQLAVKQENIRKLIACHSAIKAGDKLTALEISQLIKDLYQTENPATCPHGRPTMARITLAEIAKRFGR